MQTLEISKEKEEIEKKKARIKKRANKSKPSCATSTTTSKSESSATSTPKLKTPTPSQLRLYQKTKMGGPLCMSPEQSILNILRQSLLDTFQSPNFQVTLREIKNLFLERDFLSIFGSGNSEYLKTYAAEYASSRALCYHEIFVSNPLLLSLLGQSNGRIMCLGAGNGSELLGLAAAQLRATIHEDANLVLHIQDFADYKSDVLIPLEETIRSKWGISTTRLVTEYSVSNVLDLGKDKESEGDEGLTNTMQSSHLVTSFFLLNELWMQSKSSTVKFLMNLVATVKSGTYFLFIDSAGSFSEVNVNGKGYMVYHLLDQIRDFEIVDQTDSKWYRYPQTPRLSYPTPLNNIRYFMRLYRKK
jgi:25S rRNA (uracil2843-N3)-methyltransferase